MYIRKDGTPYTPVYDIDKYSEKVKEELLKQVSEEEANKSVKFLLDNHKRIAKDARDFHKIILKMRKEFSMK